MAKFTPMSWENGWNEELSLFNTLRRESAIVDRKFYQRNGSLYIKYVFESGARTVFPIEYLEEMLGRVEMTDTQ